MVRKLGAGAKGSVKDKGERATIEGRRGRDAAMSNPGIPAPGEGPVPTFESFAEIVDPEAYAPLPDDWLIGCSDIVSSTEAIRAGRYKVVNTAGAAVIAAVSNAVSQAPFPFVFGGDGASFAVPSAWEGQTRAALAATATFVREEFGLQLRVGLVPVADVRAVGRDVRLARFKASRNVSYAMFSGGGLAWADEQLKAGRYAVEPAPPGARPDLSGLSCRFDEIPSRRGTILSLIVRPAPGGDPMRYRRAIEDILRLVEESQDGGRPLPAEGPAFAWLSRGIGIEARMIATGRISGLLTKARLLAFSVMGYVLFRFRLPLFGFDPVLYMADLVANSDYRKYDDGLRMTIDTSPDLADRIETRLAAALSDVEYGLHRQGAALMTCITRSPFQRDHIHFIDGAAGGYATAAGELKAARS